MTADIKGQYQLLNALEPDAFERVAKNLTRVKRRPKEVVYKPNEPIDHLTFSEDAVVCLMTITSNGDTIEAATVGREGVSSSTSACHELHGLQERCARWILMTLDRVDSDRFVLTEEFLAQLLGTNRPTVSVLVSTLEKAGILNVEGVW